MDNRLRDYIEHSRGLETTVVIKLKEILIDTRIFYCVFANFNNEEHCISRSYENLEKAMEDFHLMKKKVRYLSTIKTILEEEINLPEDLEEV